VLLPEAINAFAAALDPAAVKAASAKSGVVFPIKFDNQEAEVRALHAGFVNCRRGFNSPHHDVETAWVVC